MSDQVTIQLTLGGPGSGKTYARVAWLVKVFFANPEAGDYITNFPLDKEAIGKYCANIYGGSPDLYSSRIVLLEEWCLDEWRKGISGPWEHFEGWDLSGAHIAIDECARWLPKRAPQRVSDRWEEYFGEIRHSCCTWEFITQDFSKVNRFVNAVAGRKLELGTGLSELLFGIPLGDYCQLVAKIRGKYTRRIRVREYERFAGKWSKVDDGDYSYLMTADIFALYNSYSSGGAGQGGTRQRLEWERYTWVQFILWLLNKNAGRLLRNGCRVFGVGALLCVPLLIIGFLHYQNDKNNAAAAARRNAVADVADDEKSPDLQPSPGTPSINGFPMAVPASLVQSPKVNQKVSDVKPVGKTIEIIAASPSMVATSEGFFLVGEQIDGNRKIAEISLARSRVILDDGSGVDIGGRLQVPSVAGADVGRLLPSESARGTFGDAASNRSTNGNHTSARNTVEGGVGAYPPTDGGQLRDRGGSSDGIGNREAGKRTDTERFGNDRAGNGGEGGLARQRPGVRWVAPAGRSSNNGASGTSGVKGGHPTTSKPYSESGWNAPRVR